VSEKQSSQITWIRQKFHLSWCCKQEIDKIWHAKVAIKNENITSSGGIYHIMDIFQSWALKDKDGKQQTDIFGRYTVF